MMDCAVEVSLQFKKGNHHVECLVGYGSQRQVDSRHVGNVPIRLGMGVLIMLIVFQYNILALIY